jgi:uncharacterized protein (UPF0332 family)
VNTPFTPDLYMRKAQIALSGAQLLLNAGDSDVATSRAYYAMFDAAPAALFALGIEEANAPIKTHNGLMLSLGSMWCVIIMYLLNTGDLSILCKNLEK